MIDRHLAFVLCVMTYAAERDRQTGRGIAVSIVGQASRLRIPEQSEQDMADGVNNVEDLATDYVNYEHGDRTKLNWLDE